LTFISQEMLNFLRIKQESGAMIECEIYDSLWICNYLTALVICSCEIQ
jgi:hypothetical protein